jgi:hypothetical protein
LNIKKENLMPWSNWKVEDVGIKVAGAPAVSSWKEGRLDVFVRSLFKRMYHKVYDNETWQDVHWRDLSDDHNIEVSPAAVSWGPNRVDLFAVWDRQVRHRAYDNGTWNPWEHLEGVTDNAPAAASWKVNRVDVLVQTTDRFTARRFWESGVTNGWTGWENVGGASPMLLSAPAAVATGPNRIDLFGRGPNDRLIHNWYKGVEGGGGWVEIDSLPIKDAPAVVSAPTADQGRVDVFVRGADDLLKHRIYFAGGQPARNLPGEWAPGGSWENISMNKISGPPGAVAWWSGKILKRVDCFAQDANNNLIHTWWK